MRMYLQLFCLVLPILIALDAVWLGVIASGFYASMFQGIVAHQINYPPAILFYVLYALCLVYLVLYPSVVMRSFVRSMGLGAVVGFTVYMAFNLTNMSVLPQWPVAGAAVDMLWGTLMTSIACGLTYLTATNVFKI